MNFRTIKHRYLIFTAVFTFTYAIVILPNLIPVLDQLPSPIATLLFLGVFAVSLWLLLYAVARENAFAQVTVVTLATMSGALGLNALYPTLNIPFYGSQGLYIASRNEAPDTAIGWIILRIWPGANTAFFLSWPHPLSWLFVLTYGLGVYLLLLVRSIFLGNKELAKWCLECFG